MKYWITCLALIWIVFFDPIPLWSQNMTVRGINGIVLDFETGVPLPYAHLVLKAPEDMLDITNQPRK